MSAGYPYVVAVMLASPASAATVISGPVTWSGNGHSYALLSQSTWDDAEATAIALGGHLTTIDDATEDAFVFSTFGSPAATAGGSGGIVSLWIGLNDVAQEGNFVWADGSPVGYTHFQFGEPFGGFSDEDYIGILVTQTAWQPGVWHDIVSDGRLNDRCFGVVEIAPAPGSVCLLGALGLAGLSRRR